MDSDGVAPPESEDNRFTVCPATAYGITVHILFVKLGSLGIEPSPLDFQSNEQTPVTPTSHTGHKVYILPECA